MEEAVAHENLLKWFAMQEKQVKLRQEYEPRFAKVLPLVKVVRYFQVENRMSNLLGYQVSKDVPIVR